MAAMNIEGRRLVRGVMNTSLVLAMIVATGCQGGGFFSFGDQSQSFGFGGPGGGMGMPGQPGSGAGAMPTGAGGGPMGPSMAGNQPPQNFNDPSGGMGPLGANPNGPGNQGLNQGPVAGNQGFAGTPDPNSSAVDQECLRLVNQHRQGMGLQPFQWDATMAQTAMQWSQQMAQSGQFDHDPNFASAAMAENIYMGSPDPNSIIQGYLESPGHRANIEGQFSRFGTGTASSYNTQRFG